MTGGRGRLVRAWNVWSVHVELCKNDMQLCSWGVARVMVSETSVCVVTHGGLQKVWIKADINV
jgi:hypothetical protein